MAGGLAALLDDVAALAKLAASSVDDVGAAAGRASVKAAGVVVDDTAVTPAYVQGLTANRELPIIGKIAKGSLRNKLLFILPAALLLSAVAPLLVEVILMIGGTYLCFEGAEKIHHRLTHRDHGDDHAPAVVQGADAEAKVVGRYMVHAMPRLLAALSAIGMAAMLWVGGHILLVGAAELGWHTPYDLVHDLENAVSDLDAVGGVVAWFVNTLISALIGLVVGLAVVAVVTVVHRRRT